MNKRVHEIAKERGLPAKDVLARLKEAGVDVKASSSSVDEDVAKRILANGGAAKPSSAPGDGRSAQAKPKAKTIDALLTTSSGAEPAHKPADKHAAKLAEAAPADAKAKAAKPDKTIEKTPAVASDDAAAAKSPHPPAVQIGAFSSRALAEAAAAKGAGGHARRIVPITRADGTVLYRASLTGFASRDAASAFCGKLKASGASCFVPR